MSVRPRYATLEALRGIAAFGVVLMHGERMFGAASPASGYLAVDFFFLLSGFIMAHVYAAPLQGSLTPLRFLRARVIRLYPLYLAGTVAMTALVTASLLVRHKDTLWLATRPLTSFPLALFMMPSPVTVPLYPLDGPAWTLLLELMANVAFGYGLWRSRTALLATVGLAASALAALAWAYGTLDLGWTQATMLPGLARVLFSFPLGVLLYGVRHRVRLPTGSGLAAAAILVAMLYAHPSAGLRPIFDSLFAMVVSPALLLAAASVEPASRRGVTLCLFLGAISYPVYVLHHSMLVMGFSTIERHVPEGPAFAVACVALLAGMTAAAWAAAVLDHRVRLGITAWLHRAPAVSERAWSFLRPMRSGRKL